MTKYNLIRPETKLPLLLKLFKFIRIMMGGDRHNNLYISIKGAIQKIKTNKKTKLIDFGCGNFGISKQLIDDNIVSEVIGIDTYNNNQSIQEFKNIRYLNINNIDQILTEKEIDIVLISDVIHHMEKKDIAKYIKVLKKSANFIIIKEVMEYGFFSRQISRFCDFYGNYAIGTKIPESYFSKKSWAQFLTSNDLNEISIINNVKVYDGLFRYISKDKYHFISIIRCR